MNIQKNVLSSAAFDWDNTCIAGDTNFMCVHDILDGLKLYMTPEQLEQTLPDSMLGRRVFDQGIVMSALKKDILTAYSFLWPMLKEKNREAARQTDAFFDFRVKMMLHYESSLILGDDHPHADGNLPHYFGWLGWLSGMPAQELQDIAISALKAREGRPIEDRVWYSASAGEAGLQHFKFKHGATRRPEMIDLMECLNQNGLIPYVMTGGLQMCVQAVAAYLKYPIPQNNFYGTQLEVNPHGILTGKRLDSVEYPAVWNAGKTACILRHVPTPPLLVAGDSDADLAMLTGFPETQIRLVVNRHSNGHIRSLYELPRVNTSDAQVKTLVQGFSLKMGHFHNSQDSF